MNNSQNIFFIGGGPFSVLCALYIRRRDKDSNIVIFESDREKSLKRILVSGNGRANFYNDDFINNNMSNKVTTYKEYLRLFDNVNKEELLNYLKDELDFYYYKDKEGRYYPYSNTSSTLRDTLLNKCQEERINFVLDEKILEVNPTDNLIVGTKGDYHYDKLIIGVGGESYDREANANLDLFKSLNLKMVKRTPALCPLVTVNKIYKELVGVRVKGNLKLLSSTNDVLYKENDSELLFKKDGISGIGVFSSTLFLKDNCKIQFDVTESQGVKLDLPSEFKVNDLKGAFNYKIIDYLHFVYGNKFINKKDLLNAFTFKIKSTYGFKDSQISLGGIDLSEINDDLSLVKYKNIYVGGEAINLHCVCGGYNMGLAFLCASKVAKCI